MTGLRVWITAEPEALGKARLSSVPLAMYRRHFLRRAGAALAAAAVVPAAGCTVSDERNGASVDSAPPSERSGTAPPDGEAYATWDGVRRQFSLSPETVHMSALLVASHPRPVQEAIDRHRRRLNEDPVTYLEENNTPRKDEARQAAADYLGTSADQIALTDSTTMGLGLVYGALRLEPGHEILTTPHDHYSTFEALRLRAERTGATVRRAALYDDPAATSVDEVVGRMRAAITDRTRVLAVTWVHSSTGLKLPMPAIPAESKPLEVTGRIKTISDGRYRNKGPMYAGVAMDMGTSVVLDTGRVEIVIISRHVEPHDINVLLSLGIDPLQKRYVMLKSRIHWRAGLKHIAREIIECAGVGVCTSDYSQLNFTKVRRPIYPLDPMEDRRATG